MTTITPLLSPKDAAAMLGVSVKTLRGFVRDGLIPYVNVGRGAIRTKMAFEACDVEECRRAQRKLTTEPTRRLGPAFSLKPKEPITLDLQIATDFTVGKAMEKCRLGKKTRKRLEPHLVYFIISGRLVKIGCSSDPLARLRQLSTGNAHGMSLVAVVIGGRKVERELHKAFADYHHEAEWFHAEGRLLEFVERLASEYTVALRSADNTERPI